MDGEGPAHVDPESDNEIPEPWLEVPEEDQEEDSSESSDVDQSSQDESGEDGSGEELEILEEDQLSE